jgi:hypothetical protein
LLASKLFSLEVQRATRVNPVLLQEET